MIPTIITFKFNTYIIIYSNLPTPHLLYSRATFPVFFIYYSNKMLCNCYVSFKLLRVKQDGIIFETLTENH